MRIEKMRLHHIRMIVMVADGAPVREISKAMHLERGGISFAVRRCEDMLGSPIFVRKAKKLVGMTPEGLELITRFRAILAMLDGDMETVWQVAESARPQWVPAGLQVIQRRAA